MLKYRFCELSLYVEILDFSELSLYVEILDFSKLSLYVEILDFSEIYVEMFRFYPFIFK